MIQKRYLDTPYYNAWKRGDLSGIRGMWDENSFKRSTGVQVMLAEFITSVESLSDYAECIDFYWTKRTNVSTVRSQLSQYLTEFKKKPGFGCISHLIFLNFLDERNILKMNDADRATCARAETISWIVSAVMIHRLGRHSLVRDLSIDLVRILAHML